MRFVAIICVGSLVASACSNDGASCPAPGGPITASPDDHCTSDAGAPIVQSTQQASCHATAPDGGTTSADYGATLDNASGDEDDCKYHASWTSTAVCENAGVVFTLVATNKTDGTPLVGAAVTVEAFLGTTHPSPTPYVTSTEGPSGTYVTKPVRFDAPGDWTVRFHFFQTCGDALPDSPHGHVAFHVRVP